MSTEFLRVLLQGGTEAGLTQQYQHVVKAIVTGAYARLASDALIEDIVQERLEAQRAQDAEAAG